MLVAIGFGIWFASAHGGGFGAEYFAGYIVEKCLPVDNLFVFVIIMAAPTPLSLGVIITILVVVTVASLIKTRNDPSAKAHAGSLRGHDAAEH